MTLSEAIIHCEEVANRCAVTDGDLKCEMQHRQLAEWLRELQQRRAQSELCGDAVSRQRLLSDLKELVAAWKKYPVMAEQIKGVETAIGYVESIPSVKLDSKELSLTQNAHDTISRQAAIDTFRDNL